VRSICGLWIVPTQRGGRGPKSDVGVHARRRYSRRAQPGPGTGRGAGPLLMPRVRTKGTVILSDPDAGSLVPSFVSRTDATFGPLRGLDFPFRSVLRACVDQSRSPARASELAWWRLERFDPGLLMYN
jgi:hypothetical protein